MELRSSSCAVFSRHDLLHSRLEKGQCPVRTHRAQDILAHRAPFRKYKGQMRYTPFCPEHGLRIHRDGFVYYNGRSKHDVGIATRRNLVFNSDYYVRNILESGAKVESKRLCYESSEDAVTYNVFTELLSHGFPLNELVAQIAGREVPGTVELYLWGGSVDLVKGKFVPCEHLKEVRRVLEKDVGPFQTEPDIMLIIPHKILICIEAKFGSKNPIAKDSNDTAGQKPKSVRGLRARYCEGNPLVDSKEIFDFGKDSERFHEQIFRNIVFAVSMSKLASIDEWYVANLRNQHVMNLKRGKPESLPIVRNVRSILKRPFKKRFVHLTWEDIYEKIVKPRAEGDLSDLAHYFKTKSLNCRRAFNCF